MELASGRPIRSASTKVQSLVDFAQGCGRQEPLMMLSSMWCNDGSYQVPVSYPLGAMHGQCVCGALGECAAGVADGSRTSNAER